MKQLSEKLDTVRAVAGSILSALVHATPAVEGIVDRAALEAAIQRTMDMPTEKPATKEDDTNGSWTTTTMTTKRTKIEQHMNKTEEAMINWSIAPQTFPIVIQVK